VKHLSAELTHFTNKGLISRQRIVATAMDLIRAQGYSNTSIQAICTQVGIGVGTFYHYFRSKQDVLVAYIEEENIDLLEYYANLDKSSYGRALLAIADYYLELYFVKGPTLISNIYSMLLFSTINLGEIGEFAFQKILRDVFTQGQRSGEFSEAVSIEFLCNMAMGEWYYFTSLWCMTPEAFPIREKITERYAELLKLISTSPT
jgi:TetR/AcrR family fatty acid metabolism transcriptional regulator